MRPLADLARLELTLVFALLVVAAVIQTLSGRVRISGLFQNKVTGAFDPGRLQLLVVTLLTAMGMLTELGHSKAVALPSNALLYAMGGGQTLYLIRKYLQVFPLSKGE